MMTANHVIAERSHGALYIGGSSKTVELEAEVAYSSGNLPIGQIDKYDSAVASLSDNMLDRLGQEHFIDLESHLLLKPALPGDRFMILGYPHSKNRHAMADPLKLPTVDWAFITRAKEKQECAAAPHVNMGTHLMLEWDSEQTVDADLNRTISPNPRGMSGGAVFDLGNFTSHEVLGGISLPKPRLVAIPVELHARENSIVCIRVTTIVRMLDAANIWPRSESLPARPSKG